MKDLIDFYKKFLQDRNIASFDGRILCRYLITDSEFSHLENLLCKVNLYDTHNSNTVIAPLFVLYASESWRRNYNGGLWSWETILNNLNQPNLNVHLRQRYVTKGFKFLKRSELPRMIGTTIRYLGSIACESGIPINLLNDPDNKLIHTIKEIYNTLDTSVLNISEIQIVEDCITNNLPTTYHNEYFYFLISDLVNFLIILIRDFNLTEVENPVEHINRSNPEWINNLPIVLDTNNNTFFNTLLSNATEISKTNNNRLNRLKVNYFLKNQNGIHSLYYNLQLKNGIYDPEILGITQNEFNQLPNRFVIAKNDSIKTYHLGYLDKVNNNEKFRVENLSSNDVDVSFEEDVTYFLMDFEGNNKVYLDLNVIDFKNNDSPLIFHNDDNKWKLKSIGSSKFKQCTYRILISENSSINLNTTKLDFKNSEFKLYETNVEVVIQNNDGNQFKVNFSETLDCNRYEWLRYISPLKYSENSNKSVYIGFPNLIVYNSRGRAIKRYTKDNLQVYYNKGWHTINDDLAGRFKVRLFLNNITEYAAYINILPSNFSIIFHNKKIQLCGLPNNTGIEVENTDFNIDTNILTYNGTDSGYTNIRFKSPNSEKPCQVVVPLPINSDYFTMNGARLANDTNISINKINGIRINLVNLNATTNTKIVNISISNALINLNITIPNSYLLNQYSTYEISLITFKDVLLKLFSIDRNNDSEIIIRLSNNTRLKLRKYDSAPYYIPETNSYSFPAKCSIVKGFRLDTNFYDGEILDFSINPQTNLLSDPPNKGFWFLYSPDEAENYFRPVALWVDSQPAECNAKTDFESWTFPDISKIRDNYLRGKALNRRLKAAAKNYDDEEWIKNLLPLSIYFNSSILTLSSFDIWKIASSSDITVAAMFFRLDNIFIHKFSNEFSIIWQKIAVYKWKKVFKNYKKFCIEHYNDQELVDAKINQKMKLLEKYDLQVIKSILSDKVEQMDINMLLIVLENALDGLVIRNPNNNLWPNKLRTNTEDWFNQCNLNLDNELKEIINRGDNNRQYSVKYLPILLAYASVNKINLNNLEQPEIKYDILQGISFDSEWHKDVFSWFQGYFYTENLKKTLIIDK